ncbi:UNVERIFIED_CONTAM: hypothetical protein FKN15_016915 [Acipenser sinensis]
MYSRIYILSVLPELLHSISPAPGLIQSLPGPQLIGMKSFHVLTHLHPLCTTRTPPLDQPDTRAYPITAWTAADRNEVLPCADTCPPPPIWQTPGFHRPLSLPV